jgi:hypothetical protein
VKVSMIPSFILSIVGLMAYVLPRNCSMFFCSCGMIFQSAATVDTELDVGMINLAFSDYSWRYGAFAMFGTQWEMALCTRQTGGA